MPFGRTITAPVISVPVKVVNAVVNAVLGLLALLKINTSNRVVIFLTPFLSVVSGYLFTVVARYLPITSHYITRGELLAVFLTGAGVAASHTLLWLYGWQKHEGAEASKEIAFRFNDLGEATGGFVSDVIGPIEKDLAPAIEAAVAAALDKYLPGELADATAPDSEPDVSDVKPDGAGSAAEPAPTGQITDEGELHPVGLPKRI